MLDHLKNDKVLLLAVENYLKAHYWKVASFYQIFQLGSEGEVLRVREGFDVFIVSENIEIIGLIASCGGGLTLVHFTDERAKTKYSVLKTLLSLRPTCLKGDVFSVTLTQKILEKSIREFHEEQYYWMCLCEESSNIVSEAELLSRLSDFRQSGGEVCLANQIEFQTMLPFLIEVEKYFNRNPLSVNLLKKKMTERSLLDAYLLAVKDGLTIGQGMLEYSLPRHRVIGGIYVSEKNRKGGVGDLITRALIQTVFEKNSNPALTVEVGNENAINMYRQLGFEICADQKTCYIKL